MNGHIIPTLHERLKPPTVYVGGSFALSLPIVNALLLVFTSKP